MTWTNAICDVSITEESKCQETFLNVLTGLGMGTFTNIEWNISQDKSRGQLSLGEYQLTNICTHLCFEQNTSVQYIPNEKVCSIVFHIALIF